jgi:hypothetical protein
MTVGAHVGTSCESASRRSSYGLLEDGVQLVCSPSKACTRQLTRASCTPDDILFNQASTIVQCAVAMAYMIKQVAIMRYWYLLLGRERLVKYAVRADHFAQFAYIHPHDGSNHDKKRECALFQFRSSQNDKPERSFESHTPQNCFHDQGVSGGEP